MTTTSKVQETQDSASAASVTVTDWHICSARAERPPIPSRVQIGPSRFMVDASVEAIRRERAEEGDANSGAYLHYNKQTIVVDPTMAPDAVARSLLHEVLHGLFHLAGRADDTRQGTLGTEQLVTVLAPLLLDLLRRNPVLVAYLTYIADENEQEGASA